MDLRTLRTGILLAAIATVLASFTATATTTTYSPNPPDLYDLPHGYVYVWRISGITVPSGQTVVGANLTFKNIWNWTLNDPNAMYVHMFDTATSAGVSSVSADGKSGIADALLGPTYFGLIAQGTSNTYLETLQNLNMTDMTPQTIPYAFSSAQLVMLRSYLANGDVALGFDPDCHFFNDGVTLSITTGNVVPEPASIVLLGSGMLGLAGWARRRGNRAASN